jgi:beta-galactosidase
LGRTIVKTKYRPGTLKAIALDEKGKPLSEDLLASGNLKETIATLHPESKEPTPNDHLLYVRIALGDKEGNINPDLKSSLTIEDVKGGKLLGLGNGSPFHPESYLSNKATAYMGEALAIFKVDDIKEFDFRLKSDWNEVRFKD